MSSMFLCWSETELENPTPATPLQVKWNPHFWDDLLSCLLVSCLLTFSKPLGYFVHVWVWTLNMWSVLVALENMIVVWVSHCIQCSALGLTICRKADIYSFLLFLPFWTRSFPVKQCVFTQGYKANFDKRWRILHFDEGKEMHVEFLQTEGLCSIVQINGTYWAIASVQRLICISLSLCALPFAPTAFHLYLWCLNSWHHCWIEVLLLGLSVASEVLPNFWQQLLLWEGLCFLCSTDKGDGSYPFLWPLGITCVLTRAAISYFSLLRLLWWNPFFGWSPSQLLWSQNSIGKDHCLQEKSEVFVHLPL